MEKFKKYVSLTKPGVLMGNVITGAAGFLLGVGVFRTFDWVLFVATIVGMTLVIAGACAINNVFDRDVDALMARTKQRAVASGQIKVTPATIYALSLATIGILILILWTNWYVVAIGVIGYVTYVWLYGATSKRKSVHGTLVGSLSGAMPILAGYCAVAARIDSTAILVFLALFFWQFSEFYSIAIYRMKEYKSAKIPVMPVVYGKKSTIVQIFAYTILFVVSGLLLTVVGSTGWFYFIVMGVAGLYFIRQAYQGLAAKDKDAWARRTFHVSLKLLLIYSAMIAIGPWIV